MVDPNAAQMVIWIDQATDRRFEQRGWGRTLSNLPKLVSGRHLIQALEVWLYHIDHLGEKSEVARRLKRNAIRFDR